jgi:nucleoside-diphosphate-sugar epimerase
MSQSVVVTGAAGFVGASVVARLAAEGRARVTSVVHRPCDTVDSRFATVCAGDLAAANADLSFLSGASVVVHLANRAHVRANSVRGSAEEVARVNVTGTVNVARRAADYGVRRFVYISSIGVNGNHTGESAFRETDSPCPYELYAQSKWEAEKALRLVEADSGMAVVVIRPPLVYGANAPGNFGRLLRLVRSGIPLPFGLTRNRRSLVGIDNLVDFIIVCMNHPAARGETFLVSDGEDVSTPELIRRLARSMGRRATLLPIPTRPMIVAASLVGMRGMARQLFESLRIDSGKARDVLDWQAPVPLDIGLHRAAQLGS